MLFLLQVLLLAMRSYTAMQQADSLLYWLEGCSRLFTCRSWTSYSRLTCMTLPNPRCPHNCLLLLSFPLLSSAWHGDSLP